MYEYLFVLAAAAVAALGSAGTTVWITRRGLAETRRTASGSVGVSDARTLWNASERIRNDLVTDIAAMRSEVLSLRTEVRNEQQQRFQAQAEVKVLRDEVVVLRLEIHRLQRTVEP